ncbi:uncharacterized protein LOC109837734 isoform X2 [Asparagus officinalis]|uniref:uncharacterized protein LOC109837734 isoform X2 n=1 Tax=Asparagus officinalis TaxID=4686 RepID=UPI00098E22FB|nr:uncharacterized protein LOC109837734 isoform X2 [Asparagus officinalis]
MIPASPSSSTLSPLAPPFTVDRLNISSHRPQPYAYPPPSPSVPEFNVNEFSPEKSAGESASWMDPSLSFNVSPFSAGGASESFMTYGDAYGAWHGKHVDSSERPVHIGADSSVRQDERPAIYQDKATDSCNNGSASFQFSKPNVFVDECDASNSNSYDRYITQLVSCSTAPIIYYPPKTCSSSAKDLTPANETNALMYFVPRNWYSTTQHGNLLYNVDDSYVDHMLGNKKVPGIDQYSDGKESDANSIVVDSNMKGNNRLTNFSIGTSCSTLGKEVTTANPKVYSPKMTHGFETKQLNFTESIVSSSRPNSSLRISSEALDQPHLSVDSPCWKGAAASQYLFGVGDGMIDSHLKVNELKGSDDLNQAQKCIPVSGQCLRTSNYEEKDGLFCYGDMKGSLPVIGNFSPHISVCATDEILYDFNAKGSECAQIGEEWRCVPSAIKEKSDGVKYSEEDSERVNGNVKELGQVRTVIFSADRPSLEGEGAAAAETGLTNGAQDKLPDVNLDSQKHIQKCSTIGNDVKLLLQSMHSLSEVLLSSYSGVIEWKGGDHKLVQLIIDNLETFASRNTKASSQGIPKCGSHAGETGGARSQISAAKSNDTVGKHSSVDTEREFQVAVKDLESDIFAKKEDNFQAALYKNLWMQTEAALCAMKYELQLARMKLEMKDHDNQTKEKEEPVQVKKSPRLRSMPCSNTSEFTTTQTLHNDVFYPVENDAVKSREEKPEEQKTDMDDKVEASVMARLEILRGRYARSDHIRIEEQPKCLDAGNMFKDLSTRLSDLGFVESLTPQPFDNGDIGPNYDEENYLLHQTSGHPFGGASLDLATGSPFPQQFLPSSQSQRNPMRFFLG